MAEEVAQETTPENPENQELDLTNLPTPESDDDDLLESLGLEEEKKDEEEIDSFKSTDEESEELTEDEEAMVDELVDALLEEGDEETEEELDLLADETGDENDAAIVDKVYTASSYQDLLKAAKEEGITIPDRFLSAMAREQSDPNWFAQRGIFNFETLQDRVGEIEDKLDPDRVYFPKENDDPEVWDNFREKEFNIPSNMESYEEVFEGYEKTPREIQADSEFFASQLYSMEQAKNHLERESKMSVARKDMEAQQRKEVREKDFGLLKDVYGENYTKEIAELYGLVNKVAPDFFKTFRKSDAVQSAAFLNMVRDFRDSKLDVGGVDLSKYRRSIESVPNQKLDELMNKIITDPAADDKMAKSPKKWERDKYKQLHKKYDALFMEEQRRKNNGLWD